jgi:hypothetical protein
MTSQSTQCPHSGPVWLSTRCDKTRSSNPFHGRRRSRLVLATRRVEAGIAQPQPFDRLLSHNVRLDDFIHIGQSHSAIPNPFRINHQVRSMLALVQTSRLVRPYPSFESTLRQPLLEQFLQLRFRRRIAASPRMPRRALVPANENMFLELGHGENVQDLGLFRGESYPAPHPGRLR